MKLNHTFMDIIIEPLSKRQLTRIAEHLFNINIHHGRGGIRSAEITSVASGRVSGIVTREIPTSQTSHRVEQHKFTIRNGILRYIGHQRKLVD